MRPERRADPQETEGSDGRGVAQIPRCRGRHIRPRGVDTGFGYSKTVVRRRTLRALGDARSVVLERPPARDQVIQLVALRRNRPCDMLNIY